MKKVVILIFFVLTCFGCKEKRNQTDKNMDQSIITDNTNEETIVNKVYSLQEQIENYDDKYVLLFQEEGNFTNSGNTEILAFYQSKSTYYSNEITLKGIERVYCFICNETERIIKVISVEDYGTLVDTGLFKKPMDALGREIRWNGIRFCYIGDFNRNGKEELYFFEGSGRGTYPLFYEFQEDGFKVILHYEYGVDLDIVKIDTEEKILTFEGSGNVEPKTFSFIWDKVDQIYKKIDVNAPCGDAR